MAAVAEKEKLTPDFAVKVNGSDLTRKIKEDLVSLSVDLESCKVDEVVLKLRNPDFRWSDGKEFEDGVPVEVQLGYEGQELHELMSGEVVLVKASFPRRGPSTLTVVVHGLLHRLRRQQKSQAYRKVRDSDIVTKIAQTYSLTPVVEKTATKNEFLFQNNQTDLDFLLERTRRSGFELRAEGKNLVFRKPQHDKPKAADLVWSQNLRSFDVRQQVARQATSFEVRGWDPTKKAPIVFKTKVGDEKSKMGGKDGGSQITQQSFGDTPEIMVDQALSTAEEAEAWARGMWEQQSMDFLVAEGACQGEGKLKPGLVVEIKGLGGDYNGSYYLTGTRHILSPAGYTTEFQCSRSALGMEEAPTNPLKTRTVNQEQQKPQEHWIEKQFVDASGKPLKDLQYSWTMTGEKKEQKEGSLSSDGTLKARGIDPGTAHAVLKEITSAAWAQPRGDVGEPAGMMARCTGYADKTSAEFSIFEKCAPDKILATQQAEVRGGLAKSAWTYQWKEDDGVKTFQFVFKVKIESRERDSNVLDMYETVEIEGRDSDGQILREAPFALLFADGRVHSGKTNKQGKARVRGVRPGSHEVYFPLGELTGEDWK